MERKTYRPDLIPVDLVPLISRILSELQALITEKNLSVQILVNGIAPVDSVSFIIDGEELLCYSMICNLVKNAVEASSEDQQVEILLDSDSLNRVVVHNEQVVPSHIKNRFFEKYITGEVKKGTGLGTYSAKLITETLGGSINLETSSG